MAEGLNADWFRCEACGKRFRWKAESAGREARCPCGAKIRFPDHPDADEVDYDLAPEPVRPARSAPPAAVNASAINIGAINPGAAIPAVPGAPVAPTLGYQTPRKALPAGQRPGVNVDTLKNQTIPIWLLGGGVAVELVAAYLRNRNDLQAAMIEITVQLIGGTILMLAGVMLAAKVRGIEVGSFWTATLRVAAIAVAPVAVGELLMPIALLIPFGGLLQMGVQFVLYFALLGVLFDMDESDTWYCIAVIFVISIGVYFLLLWAPWKH